MSPAAPWHRRWRALLVENRLGRRLVRSAIGLGLAIGLAVTVLQVVFVYVGEIEHAREQLAQIERTQVPQLAASVWLVNDAEAAMVLDGLATLPGIAQVVLREDGGVKPITRGARPAYVLAERRFVLQPDLPGAYAVGELEVIVGPDELLYKVFRRSAFAVLSLLAALGACVGALLVLFSRDVNRHLVAMANHASTLRLDALDRPLALDDKATASPPDEIDQLAAAINGMNARIREDMSRIRLYEAELAAHRDHLEGLVQVRTLELEEKARELEEQRAAIERLANTDALTGAISRRHFEELGWRELARAERAAEPVALLALDIDHFKSVNDAHGHAGGDAVLCAFARTCEEQLRATDLFARIGGEEFVVLLPGCGAADAMLAAERIRAAVERAPVLLGGGTAQPVTVSIGVVVREPGAAPLAALLQAADEALYAAKRGGRNRVVAAEPV
jgi:diguanylate cyclase (GGDEF)-like protein